MTLIDKLFGRRLPPPPDLSPCDTCTDTDRDDRLREAERRTAEIQRRLQAIDIERDTYRVHRDDEDPPKGQT